MQPNFKADSNFAWTDLSSYDTAASRKFYKDVFGWKSYDTGHASAAPDDQFGMDQVNYHAAMLGDDTVAGIFGMPPFFQKIKMPPFWMSYLAVDGLEALVARAKAVEGVIVDVEPTPFDEGMMSLTRDPLGAGITNYEGPSIDAKNDGSAYGRMVWNELFTSSIAKVETFYRDVLGFELVRDTAFEGNRVKLVNAAGEEVAGIQEMNEALRSDKVYWLPYFSIDNMGDFMGRVERAGGSYIMPTDIGGGVDSEMFYDNTGATFGASATGANLKTDAPWYRRLF